MHTIAYSSRLAALGLVVAAVACGRAPTAPGQPSAPPDRVSGQTTFTIINGWSREAVAGATVTANGREALTDALGQVQFPATPSNCLTIEVKAVGFLERRACGLPNVRQMTLWPVANADESEVTRKWIFYNDQISGDYWSAPTHIALGPELSRAGIAETWSAATDAISEVSQGRIRFQWVTSAPEEGLLVVAAGAPVSCSVVPPWSFEIGGFCVKYDPNMYSLDRLQVSPDRLADRSTALRALLAAVGIRAHGLPGLMNLTRPESDFSEYERKTLGMLGLRPPRSCGPTMIKSSERDSFDGYRRTRNERPAATV
jgi:hypothetical protein